MEKLNKYLGATHHHDNTQNTLIHIGLGTRLTTEVFSLACLCSGLNEEEEHMRQRLTCLVSCGRVLCI